MAAPTYAQVMAELADWRAHPNQKYISGPRLINLMEMYIKHITNEGAYDPGTFQQQVTSFITTYPDRFSNLQTTLYVNQATGSDSNSGTSGSPLKSLLRASQIVNNKFLNVTINLVGSYNVTEDVNFKVNSLLITLQASAVLTFKKKTITQGETTYTLLFDGIWLKILGYDNTSVVRAESNLGFVSGDPYWLRQVQGAIKAGNDNLCYDPVLTGVGVYRCSVDLQANTVLVTGRDGLADPPFFRYGVAFESNVTSWTVDATAKISPACRKSYYRKSVLLNNTSTWFSVGTQAELSLVTGTYAVRIAINSSVAGGVIYNGTFGGVMAWFSGNTNDATNESREILLHGMALNLNGKSLKLRTVTVGGNSPGRLEVQLNEVLSSAITLEFYFTKLD